MPEASVRLTATAPDVLTEIYLIDHQLLLRRSGLGELDVELPPGIYKIKWRVGYELRERLVHLDAAGSPHLVELEGLPTLSAAPLAGSSDFRDDHAHQAAAASRATHRRAGSGAGLFFFSREVPASSADNQGTEPLETTCSAILLSPNGDRVAELTRDGVSGSTWCACTLDIDPGIYRLQIQDGSSRGTEMTVPVRAGLQTQLFFLRRTCKRDGVTWRDLALFLSAEAAFNPESSDLLQTERLRWLFAQRRHLASDHVLDLLDRCSWTKQPLQALFLAHLLLLSGKDVQSNLPDLIDAIRGRLPDGDVVPLDLEAGLEPSAPVSFAPLLRRSWEILVGHSASRPSLIPADIELARLAGRVVSSEPWLAWIHNLDPGPPVRRAIERQLLLVAQAWSAASVPASAPALARRSQTFHLPVGSGGLPTLSAGRPSLTDLPTRVGTAVAKWIASLASRSSKRTPARRVTTRSAKLLLDPNLVIALAARAEVVQDLVATLGVPRSVVESHLHDLGKQSESTVAPSAAPPGIDA